MRFQILVAIALVARISSLREEVTRFDLEVQEKAQVQTTAGHVPLKEELQAPTVERAGRPLDERVQEPTAIPAETEGFVEVASQKLNREPVELTAESCINGVITVTGKMVVKNKFKFPEECNVMRGAPGAEVALEEPLEFGGNLSFEGHLGFTATRAFQQTCIRVYEHATIAGDVQFQNCKNENEDWFSGEGRGGGLYVDTLVQWSGSAVFRNCSAGGSGGGLFAASSVTQRNGTMSFDACHSGSLGGGLRALLVTQRNGTMSFEACHSDGAGGGAAVVEDVTQEGGTMEFRNCSSETRGGGMWVGEKLYQAAVVLFHECATKDDGGGLRAGHVEQAPVGVLSFSHCSGKRGGGVYTDSMNATGPLRFRECEAAQSGGGIHMVGQKGSALNVVTFESCRAARATAIQSGGNLTVKKLEIIDTFEKAVDAQSLQVSELMFTVTEQAAVYAKSAISVEAVNMTIDVELNCTHECSLLTPATSPPKIARASCGQGTGVPKPPAFGCWACPEGYTQTQKETNGSCLECPDGAALCRAAKIVMSPGRMVHDRNLSQPLHCPTQAACQGGELPLNQSNPMCQSGYGGEGCTKCTNSNGALYLTADSSVLACTQCANTTAVQLLQWSSFLAQRSVLFVVSAASIFGAGHANAVKSSGVYLNQLMAFAAVSGSVVTVVMQTDTAQKMKFVAVQYLFGAAVFLSEAGSGQGSRSSHCLLSYISLEQTGLQGVHSLDVVIAMILVLLLSPKDFRVALVAGINCFLPGILADFAKYAVCYSLEEESSGNQKIRCDNLPFHNVFGFVLVGGGFLAVFAVALCVWIRLSSSNAKGEEVPSHVAFLTNKYKDGCRYFEAERLVRKVLLTTAAAFWPSSVYPEFQMTALLVITSASVLMYSIFQPYSRYFWNWSEFALLVTAQLLICGASTVMSNEVKWDKTDLGQKSMIVTLGAVVVGVCSAFMLKIALEVWYERQTTT